MKSLMETYTASNGERVEVHCSFKDEMFYVRQFGADGKLCAYIEYPNKSLEEVKKEASNLIVINEAVFLTE